MTDIPHLSKPSVIDSQLCSSSAVERVEKLGIFKEHCFLILSACYGKVNIRELKALGILVLAYTENAVIINGGNGNTKMINKESLIYIVLNLQMTELFMREIYFHQKLFPVLEKLEI